jgi:hypothetical protein
MTIKHYEVQTYTAFDGWTNTWSEGDKPAVFATEQAAYEALDDFFDDLKHAAMAQFYNRDDYRVRAIPLDDAEAAEQERRDIVRRAILAVFGGLSLTTIEGLLEAERGVWHAGANLGTSSQARATGHLLDLVGEAVDDLGDWKTENIANFIIKGSSPNS